jgi:predicted nucleic acid-binding Zn ribbon protein/predicted DNA-binding transcriptional regulator AlpA
MVGVRQEAIELLKADPLRSYTNVARQLGVSRERIRQIANETKLKTQIPEGYMSLAEMARRMGYSYSGLYRMCQRGELQPIRIGYDVYIHVDSQRTKKCSICGNPVGMGRSRYCSEGCLTIGQYRALKRGLWRRFHIKRGLPVGKTISLLLTGRGARTEAGAKTAHGGGLGK